jgi:hypothetical protein
LEKEAKVILDFTKAIAKAIVPRKYSHPRIKSLGDATPQKGEINNIPNVSIYFNSIKYWTIILLNC